MSLRKPHARIMAAFGGTDKVRPTSSTVLPFPRKSFDDRVFDQWRNGDPFDSVARKFRIGFHKIDEVIRERVTVLPKRAA